jgi:hypothetical protein
MFTSVDLPLPAAPISAVSSPSVISRSSPCRACTSMPSPGRVDDQHRRNGAGAARGGSQQVREDPHPGQAADADGRRQQRGELPRGHGRAAGRDGPPAVRPDYGPDRSEAGDRGLLGLQFGHPDCYPRRGGLAQVVLGLGRDQLRLDRRDPQPGAQLLQVPGDQVGGHPAHAGRPGSA